jgi:thiamine monophosphate synthase
MPRLTLGISSNASVAEMKRIKQLGVDYVLTGGPRIPWTETVSGKLWIVLKQKV